MRLLRKMSVLVAVAAVASVTASSAEASTLTYQISGYYPSALSIPYGPSYYAWTGSASNETESGSWNAVIPAGFDTQAGVVEPGGYFNLSRVKKRKIVGAIDATFTGGTYESASAECGIRIYTLNATLAVDGGGTAVLTATIKAHQQMQGASCVMGMGVLETGTITYTLP